MKNKITSSTQVNMKKRAWCWNQYLEEENTVAAPIHLFTQTQSFPSRRNCFKVGMRLEGIDPLHPSMFCVLSVAEVIGYRLRLHIDGYSECYDFWVNADSADIRPAGWCTEHNHKLHPPKGYSETDFDWEKYLESTSSQAAPKNLFKTQTWLSDAPCSVEVGMKLEAVDRKNPCLVCVASVADVIDDHFLVHFDNWDDTYDYWCVSSSPYVHPVGWCQEQGRPLTAPQGHPNPESFRWEEYLEDKNCPAAPRSAFTVRAPHGFHVNQRLEAVDRRNPMLIRAATITDSEDYRVNIHYDGWSERFDVWCDSDLPDLHPVGWCQRTGHPLEPPLAPSPPPSVSQGVCPTPGCGGVGHIKGAKYTGHHSAFGCPYSDLNTRKEMVLPDRLGGERVITFVPVTFVQKTTTMPSPAHADHHHGNQEPRSLLAGYGVALSRPRGRPPGGGQLKREPREEPSTGGARLMLPLTKRPRLADRLSQPTKCLRVKQEEEELDLSAIIPAPDHQALHQSVFLSAMSAQPGRDLPLCWDQHCKLLPGVATLTAANVNTWTTEQVSEFIHSLPGCEEQARQFKEEQIDGRAFLLLTQRDIVRIMSIKLGPALKIYNSILMFKHAEEKGQSHARDTDT